MNNKSKVEKSLKLVADINMIIALGCLGIVIVLNLYEIIIRFFLGKSLIWIQEVSVLLMVWMIFTGTTKIVYEKKDIIITILIDKLSKTKKMFVDIIGKIIVSLFFCYYIYYGAVLAISQWNLTTMVAKIRQFYFTLPVIIMSVSSLLIYIYDIYKDIAVLKKGVEQ